MLKNSSVEASGSFPLPNEQVPARKVRGFFLSYWKIQRIVAFAVSVLFLCAGAVLERYLAPQFRHDSPAKYTLVNDKGMRMTHFFEGLPVRRVGTQTAALLSSSQLRFAGPHSESFFRRVAHFFGFSATVYAQWNCTGCGCSLAHMDCTGQNCSGGSFSTPNGCNYSNKTGVDVGNTTGCGCGIYDWTTCQDTYQGCPS